MTTPREAAEAILELRHRQERKPNVERFAGAEKFSKRVKIDSVLADMNDEQIIKEVWG